MKKNNLKTESEGGIIRFLRKGSYRPERNRRLGMVLFLAAFFFFCILSGGGAIAGGSGAHAEETPAAPESAGGGISDYSLSGRISNSEKMIAAIRQGLKGHSAAITVTFDYGDDIFGELNGVIEDWMEAAQAETGAPDEGDYIRYQMGGYEYTSSRREENGRWYYSVRIVPDYYCFLSQEEETDREVRRLLRKFFFWPWTPREKKICRIYDYLCENVTYDKIHRKNPYYHKCSTAYAALVQRTASCQGYCTAMYRLLREKGIPCRIITGTAGEEELHAWIIAELDGQWYLLDPTWDAGEEEHKYYLLGTQASADHIPGDRFMTDAFAGQHPMASGNYEAQ